MTYVQLHSGIIEVGDKLIGAYTGTSHIVHRVTDKFAFVKYNEASEGKFDRKFQGWTKRRPFYRYDTYNVYRPEGQ